MATPRFITLEGGEGAGKSTQIKLLAQSFATAGLAAITTREPGGSDGAEAIRGLVVNGAVDRWNPGTESLLFMAARYDHVETKIKPALASGQFVLCDRFYDSTYVYQGIAKNVGPAWLDQLYTLLFGNLAPELTLWLDLSPKTGLARTTKRGNVGESRFESMGLDYHESLRQGFTFLSERYPNRIERIDAEKSAAEVHAVIISTVNARFGLALKPASGT